MSTKEKLEFPSSDELDPGKRAYHQLVNLWKDLFLRGMTATSAERQSILMDTIVAADKIVKSSPEIEEFLTSLFRKEYKTTWEQLARQQGEDSGRELLEKTSDGGKLHIRREKAKRRRGTNPKGIR